MTDILLAFNDRFFTADALLADGVIVTDDGLTTAVLISIFTDARARPDDSLPEGMSEDGFPDRRGWWGDALGRSGEMVRADHPTGSRLWLLAREKQTSETLARARDMVADALAWLKADGVASAIDVDAWWEARGVLGLQAMISKPTGEKINYRYQYVWEAR